MLTVPRAAANAPEQHIANVARNLGGVAAEAVGRSADFAEVSFGGKGEDLEVLDAL
jgi:hypothetical protein